MTLTENCASQMSLHSQHFEPLDLGDSDEEKEYVIVEFPDERQDETGIPMALISSTWIFEDKGNLSCYWPLYLKSASQRQKAVANHAQLLTEKCQICPVVVKYSTDDYNKACNKLRKLEIDSSESQSSDSFQIQRSKKDNRNTDFLYIDRDESDDEDDGPPTPPQLNFFPDNETRNIHKKTYTILKTIPNQKNIINKPGISQVSSSANRKSNNNETQKRPEKTCKTNINRSIPKSASSHIENMVNDKEEESDAHRSEKKCKNCVKNSQILTTLVQEIQSMKEDIKHLLRLNGEKENFEIDEGLVNFSSHEQLKEFNENLKSGEFFKKCLMKYGLVGGRGCGDTTRRILSLLIGHDLSLTMNWSGRNQKNGFDSLQKVIELIYESVRKNALSKDATNAEITSAIKNWFRNASDRGGGRSKRKDSL